VPLLLLFDTGIQRDHANEWGARASSVALWELVGLMVAPHPAGVKEGSRLVAAERRPPDLKKNGLHPAGGARTERPHVFEFPISLRLAVDPVASGRRPALPASRRQNRKHAALVIGVVSIQVPAI
jgi:hypothetical protein